MKSRSDINLYVEVSNRIMETWRMYGLAHNVETKEIVNALDGKIKGLYDDWGKIKSEITLEER